MKSFLATFLAIFMGFVPVQSICTDAISLEKRFEQFVSKQGWNSFSAGVFEPGPQDYFDRVIYVGPKKEQDKLRNFLETKIKKERYCSYYYPDVQRYLHMNVLLGTLYVAKGEYRKAVDLLEKDLKKSGIKYHNLFLWARRLDCLLQSYLNLNMVAPAIELEKKCFSKKEFIGPNCVYDNLENTLFDMYIGKYGKQFENKEKALHIAKERMKAERFMLLSSSLSEDRKAVHKKLKSKRDERTAALEKLWKEIGCRCTTG